jgi:hypothetical protein
MFEELVNQFVADNLATFIIVVVIAVVALVFLTIKTVNFHNKIRVHAKDIEDIRFDISDIKTDIKSLAGEINNVKGEINNVKGEINNVKVDLSGVKSTVESIKSNVLILSQFILKNNGDQFTKSCSPMKLTEKGESVAKALDIYSMITSNWENINSFIEENTQSKNPYDLQQFIHEQITVYPEKFIHVDDVNKLKKEAYREGINLMAYTNILMVIIRDRYFEEHDITIDEIDINDPAQKTTKAT